MSETFNAGFSALDVRVEHHFSSGDGVYIKETRIPAGVALQMHTHTYTHKSVLCSGRVRFTADGVASEVEGPAVLAVQQGIAHEVLAITPAVWLCIHACNETDADLIDHAIVGEK